MGKWITKDFNKYLKIGDYVFVKYNGKISKQKYKVALVEGNCFYIKTSKTNQVDNFIGGWAGSFYPELDSNKYYWHIREGAMKLNNSVMKNE